MTADASTRDRAARALRGRWLRTARNMRLAAAAFVLRIDASTLISWEDGESDPTPEELADMELLYVLPAGFFADPPAWDSERFFGLRYAEANDQRG